MNMPIHPGGDDSPMPARRSRRTALAAVGVVMVLASIHLLRTAFG